MKEHIKKATAFYLSVLKVSLTPSIGLADAFAFVLGIAVPLILHYAPSMEPALSDLAWQIPLGIFGSIFVFRLALSPYWVYEDLRKKSEAKVSELQKNVTTNEWGYRREHLIKLREPILAQLPRLFREVLHSVNQATNRLNLDDVDAKKEIDEVTKDIEIKQNKYGLYNLLSTEMQIVIVGCLNEHGFEVESEIRSDKECDLLLTEVGNRVFESGDDELKMRTATFYGTFFNGIAAIFLLNNSPEFASKWGDEIQIGIMKRRIENNTETKLTEVIKRVEELRIGDEVK